MNVPATPKPIKVVVLGASTCNGKNVDVEVYGGTPGAKGWVALYQDYLNVARPGSQVTNLAVNSSGTYDAMPTGFSPPPNRDAPDPLHNITAALGYMPDAVIVSYPSGGDLRDGYTINELVGNLTTIVQAADDAGVPAWVSNPNPVGPTYADGAAMTGGELNVVLLDFKAAVDAAFAPKLLDFWTPRVTPNATPEEAFADPAYILNEDNHPNAAGQQLLFQVVVDADIPHVVFGD